MMYSAWFLTLVHALVLGWQYPTLPVRVPTHFDVTGTADAWGPRWSLIVLLGLAVVFQVGFAALVRRPDVANYPVQITESNAAAVYEIAARMLAAIALVCAAIFLTLTLDVAGLPGPPLWVLPCLLLVAPIWGIVRMLRVS